MQRFQNCRTKYDSTGTGFQKDPFHAHGLAPTGPCGDVRFDSGPIAIKWKNQGGTVSMTCQIPPNCNAKLILPTQVDKIIGGMSEKVVAADDGRELRMSSGTHQLTLPLNPQ